LVNVLPAWAVNLRKKDAHPENWLITPANQVVLIDMESTKLLPAFYDFCQLVDDYPVISVDESGMQQRRDLLAKYHHYLGERIADIGTQQLVEGDSWAVLCGFILFRAAFGFARLARQRNNPSKSTTSSALRSAAMRRQHYVNLIAWFARNGPCAPVVACARHLAVMLERLDPRTA
jgi:hypothetical protein